MKRHDTGGFAAGLGAQDVLLLSAVVALPWFFGGVGLDAYRTAAAIIALAAGWALVRRGAAGLGLWRGTVWLLPAFLLGAWALAQTVPLPRPWVAALSPKAAAIQLSAFGPEGEGGAAWLRQIEEDARARVPEAASAAANHDGSLDLGPQSPEPPRRFTLSLEPEVTRERACWYAALLLAFLLVLRRTADERRAEVYRATLFVSFVALACVGILNRLTAPDRLLWLRAAPAETHPVGPYVNPSHFAGVMDLAVPWLLGCGLSAFVHRSGARRKQGGWVIALAGAIIGAAATVLSASKMAVLTLGVVSVILVAAAVVASRGRTRTALLVGSATVTLLLGAIAISGPLRRRVADFSAVVEGGLADDLRSLAWSSGVRMAGDYPLTGSGFGAFSDLFPAYLPRGESAYWLQLHNDYLEVYLAGGLIAVLLLAWLAVAFGVRAARVVRAESERGHLLPSLGLVLGLVALAAHETVDFNLQVPANALLFVVIAAMAVSPPARSAEGP